MNKTLIISLLILLVVAAGTILLIKNDALNLNKPIQYNQSNITNTPILPSTPPASSQGFVLGGIFSPIIVVIITTILLALLWWFFLRHLFEKKEVTRDLTPEEVKNILRKIEIEEWECTGYRDDDSIYHSSFIEFRQPHPYWKQDGRSWWKAEMHITNGKRKGVHVVDVLLSQKIEDLEKGSGIIMDEHIRDSVYKNDERVYPKVKHTGEFEKRMEALAGLGLSPEQALEYIKEEQKNKPKIERPSSSEEQEEDQEKYKKKYVEKK